MYKDITDREVARIKYSIKDRIMHFAPTISPAPKDFNNKEIESLRKAIEYYKEHGEKKVLIQKKHMGSYCDIYLNRDLKSSRFFSRNGFSIRALDRELLIKAAKPIHDLVSWDNVSEIIIQAELMPWSSLGSWLIDNGFETYYNLHKEHISAIKEYNLHKSINELKLSEEFIAFKNKDCGNLPSHVSRQMKALDSISIPEPEEYEWGIELYKKQLDLYGNNGEPYFEPFNYLKIIYDNGTEKVNESNIDGNNFISNKNFLIIDLEANLESEIRKAYNFFNKLTAEGAEGVMVKPDTVWTKNFAPMLKVRSKEYLQLIYGINFYSNFEYYLSKRKIKSKLSCSIREWDVSQRLLRIKKDFLSSNNKKYVDLIHERILNEKFEKKLDSRL